MKTAVMVLAIIGSVLALAVGACSGVCMSGLGEMANDGGEGASKGGSLMLFGIIQAVLGLVVGIKASGKMGRNEVLSKFEKFGLLAAGALSISNTFTFITAGVCHFIAGGMAAMYKPEAANSEDTSSEDTSSDND